MLSISIVREIWIVNSWLFHPRALQGGANMKKGQIFKNRVYFDTCGKKTKCIVMMSINKSTKTLKFMVPRSMVENQGWDQYGHIIKIFFSTHIYTCTRWYLAQARKLTIYTLKWTMLFLCKTLFLVHFCILYCNQFFLIIAFLTYFF